MLLTGSTGFLGAHLVNLLLARGARVFGVRYQRPLDPRLIPHDGILTQGPEISVLFHLGAPVVLDRDPQLLASLRPAIVDDSLALADSAAQAGVRMVSVGTCDEVAGSAPPFQEDAAAAPNSPYASLKAELSARLIARARQGDLDVRVVRPFRGVGVGERRGLVREACVAALRGLELHLTDGLQVREWNSAKNLALGILAAGGEPSARGEVLHLGGGPRASVGEVVSMIYELAGASPARIRFGALARRQAEVGLLCADTRRADRILGPLPKTDLRSALAEALAGVKAELKGTNYGS